MNVSKWLKYLSLLGCTTLVSGVELLGWQSAQAQVIREFEPRFQTQTKGNISIVGNTLMTCDEDNTNLIGVRCPDVQSGNPAFSLDTDLAANNFFFMNYVDIDGDGSTFNSSSSQLAIPAGATVAWAGLYWSGDLSAAPPDSLTTGDPGIVYGEGQPAPNSGIKNQAKLQVPGSGYQTITANNIDESGDRYSAYADVTSLVQAAGNGTYTMADVQAGTGGDRYAGWSLIVVYEDPNESLRSLNIYDGFTFVSASTPISTTISGFETPLTDGFEVEFGTVTYEGDLALVGDQFRLNSSNLSDGLNPDTNFFNSSNTRLGNRFTAKNPDYVNQLAIDIDIVDATNFLEPGDTSALLEFTSAGDVYYPTAFTFSTEIKQPVLTENFTKTVLDVNGGGTIAGDILEYEITVENTGNETATDVIISDPVPDNTTLVDGSLEVVQDPNSSNIGTKSNAPNDDTAEFDGTDAVFRVGTGATATNGGNLAVGESVTVKFRVQIDSPIDNSSNISNQASVDFNNAATETPFSGVSDDPNTSEQDDPTSTAIGSDPNLLLVKRITAINPEQSDVKTFDNFVDDDSTESDNHPNWLGSQNNGDTNTYTVGTTDGGLVVPQDDVEYSIYFLSNGNISADNVLICDLIPENMELVLNSFANEPPAANGSSVAERGLLWEYNGTVQSLTNNNDGDGGYYFPPGDDPKRVFPNVKCSDTVQANTNGAVVVNLGEVPEATAPGTPANSYGFIRFRAKVK